MFAYCNNSPLNYVDHSGYRMVATSAEMMGGFPYIFDQTSASIGDKPLGSSSIAHGGCGVVATYNTLIDLGTAQLFDNVLAYYNEKPMSRLTLDGWLGILPTVVAQYFIEQNYRVIMTDDCDAIDIHSKTADACIMYYMFTNSDLPIPFGAHYISYKKTDNGYVGRNTSDNNGKGYFTYPSDYGYRGSRFYSIGIFIYK